MIRITILVDDLNGSIGDFVCSYGFSTLIEMNGKVILFDTGTKQKPLLHNLNLAGYSPSDINAVILSHNHYDHTDGLPILLQNNPNLPVYVNKDWDREISFKGKSIPANNQTIIQKSRNLEEIDSDIYITDSHYSSDYGGVYEHACYIMENDHYLLLCGCCHPGLNKFLKDRINLNIPLNAPLSIMGGFHGFNFTEKEAKGLYPILDKIVLFHCTSRIKTYEDQFKEKCLIGIVGKTYLF